MSYKIRALNAIITAASSVVLLAEEAKGQALHKQADKAQADLDKANAQRVEAHFQQTQRLAALRVQLAEAQIEAEKVDLSYEIARDISLKALSECELDCAQHTDELHRKAAVLLA